MHFSTYLTDACILQLAMSVIWDCVWSYSRQSFISILKSALVARSPHELHAMACAPHAFISLPQVVCQRGDGRFRRFSCCAAQGTPPPLHLADGLSVDPPLILAPMAGVTTAVFRELCREYGAGLCVSEMLLADSVATGKAGTRARFAEGETRSAQLYGVDPGSMRAAAEVLCEDGVQHLDINFGCPAPKVLRRGGGAAVPANLQLLRALVSAVTDVAAPCGVAVTGKMRLGLHSGHLTYLEAGRALEECGASAVTLHSRTAAELYEPRAGRTGWPHIAALRGALAIPVLGNGDVFSADDALEMLAATGAAGVVIGRGCLGRPWLFSDLNSALRTGKPPLEGPTVPNAKEVSTVLLRHVEGVVAWLERDGIEEADAVRSMRKWFSWYWRGYTGLPERFVARLCQVSSLVALRVQLCELDQALVSHNLSTIIAGRGKEGKASREISASAH